MKKDVIHCSTQFLRLDHQIRRFVVSLCIIEVSYRLSCCCSRAT